MKSSVLRRINPLVKTYAENRGKHKDQKFPSYTDREMLYHANAVGAIVGNNSIIRGKYGASYCFGNLLRDSPRTYDEVDAILIQVPPCPEGLSEDAYYHFIEWVLNYSPWRKVFVTKSIGRVKKKGVVIIDPTFPANTVAGAAIALRMAWENYAWSGKYHKIGLWWDVAQKVDPKITFAITDCIIQLKDDIVSLKGGSDGHSPLYFQLNKFSYDGSEGLDNTLDNYVLEKVYDKTDPWAVRKSYTTPNIWRGGKKKDVLFQDHVVTLLKDVGKKSNNNPFSNTGNALSIQRDKVVDALISEIPNIEKVMYAK